MARRVLYISHLGGLGGGETFLLNHLSALDRSRFEPWTLVGSAGSLLGRLQELGVQALRIPFRYEGGLFGRLRGIATIFWISWFIRRHQIQLVHINDIELGKYAALAARLSRVPSVWTCHGWWYAGTIRECYYRAVIDRIAMVSSPVYERLTARGLLSRERVAVIHPGIDLHRHGPQPSDQALLEAWDLDPAEPVIAIIGRFQPLKGHANFLAAARRVLAVVPAARFLIIGDNVFGVAEDDAHYRSLVSEVAQDLTLQQRVRFVGFQSDIPRVMSVIDVLVSASESETFGMVHVEAMACGRPVVSTNRGGPRDIVVEGETGYLVPPADPDALAYRIIRLCQNPELRKTMGIAGRRRAEEMFEVRCQTQKYEALYEELCP